MRSLTHQCVRLTAVSCALLPCLTGCTDNPQHTLTSPTSANGPMSDPIAGLQPQAPTASTPEKPAEPTITESQLGIPFYPNAVPSAANGASDAATTGAGDAMILLQTHDSVEKVVAFYMEKLKSTDETGNPQEPIKSDSTMDGKPVVTLSQIAGRTLKAAEIRQVDNMTVIELMRMEAPMHGSASLPNHIPAPGSSTLSGIGGVPGASNEAGATTPGTTPQDPGLKYP